MQPVDVLREVSRQVAECTKCALHQTRKLTVPGEGDSTTQVLLIGEGPGFYENEQGRPFVGAAGKFLDELLQKGGQRRQDVFITNVVKCRPPGNRDPLPEELAACSEYLEQQIEAIHPSIIITLGRFSMARFFNNTKISAVHAQARWVNDYLVIPMYHPAAALHQPALKATLLQDFSRLPEWIEQAQRQRPQPMPKEAPAAPAGASAPADDSETRQLSLF